MKRRQFIYPAISYLVMRYQHSDADPITGRSCDFEWVAVAIYGLDTYLDYFAAPFLGLTFGLQ